MSSKIFVRSPKIRYCVLVADGGRARLFSYNAKNRLLAQEHALAAGKNQTESTGLTSDSAGRAFNITGPGKHTLSSHNNPHDKVEQRFAESLATLLETNMKQNIFDKIILIADPKTLGGLRNLLKSSVARHIVAEAGVDLTNESPESIEKRVHHLIYPNS